MKELNFSFLLTVFKKHWWKIVAITLLVMILAACVTQFFIPKKYSSSVKFYVVNINTDLDYTNATYVAASEYLVNDYIEIIHGDTLMTNVANVLKSEGYKISADSLRSMIKCDSKAETSVFTVSVSHTDKKLAYRTAQLLEKLAPPIVTEIAKPGDTAGKRAAANVDTVLKKLKANGDLTIDTLPNEQYIENIIEKYGKSGATATEEAVANVTTVLEQMKKDGGLTLQNLPSQDEIEHLLENNGEPIDRLECISVVKSPVEASSHDSPNLIVNTLLAGVIAAVLAYGFFLILSSIASTLVTEEDIKNMIQKPVMSAIPHWETTAKK